MQTDPKLVSFVCANDCELQNKIPQHAPLFQHDKMHSTQKIYAVNHPQSTRYPSSAYTKMEYRFWEYSFLHSSFRIIIERIYEKHDSWSPYLRSKWLLKSTENLEPIFGMRACAIIPSICIYSCTRIIIIHTKCVHNEHASVINVSFNKVNLFPSLSCRWADCMREIFFSNILSWRFYVRIW